MRLKYKFSLVIAFFVFHYSYSQQIITDDSLPLEQLIQQNLGQNCVEISNILSNVNGNINGINSFGYFERGDSSFPFENGILLTTGNVNSAGNVLNTIPISEGDTSWGTDIDLENALDIEETLNATSIQFNFVSVASQIQFNYILASEEYQQDFPCRYSDGFAFLIREAGSSDPFLNIALIPGTSIPVNTTTIHDVIPESCPAENASFFEGNNIGDTNYNGRTVVLSATATILPNVAYEIKLIIADQTDPNIDSAVFIEGNSFTANVDLGPDIATCGDSVTLNGDIQNSQATYQWFQNDVVMTGENNPILQAVSTGTYKVEVTIQLNETSCVIEDTVEVTLDTEQAATQISDFIFCDDNGDGVENFDLTLKNNEVLASVPPSSYNISYHSTSEDAENNVNPIMGPIQNTSSPQSIFVRIEDTANGCLAYSEFNLVVNEKPEYVDPDPIIACIDPTLDGYTFVDLNVANDQIINGGSNLFVSYHYSEPEADLGSNPIFSPYANFNMSQTLYVRIYDALTGCFSTTSIFVEIQDSLAINTEDQWINACEQDEDGFENFDLTSVIANVLQGLTGMDVSYHTSYNDAQFNVNPIPDPEDYQNTTPNYQLIYIRIQDTATGCYAITNLELHSNIIINTLSSEAIYVCDDPSNDGIENFDLNEVEVELEDGYEEFEVTFYINEDDRADENNPIDESVPFNVINNGTIIYAIVVDGDCTELVDVALVIAPAVVLTPQTADYCDYDDDGFTTLFMDTFNTVAAQGVSAANVKYYLTEDDAINNENILPDYVYNTTNPQLFYVRVTNAQTECYGISSLEVNVVSAPTVMVAESIIICDDNDDGVFNVNLEAKIPEITSSTAGLDITFYNDYYEAFEGQNEISTPEDYSTATQYIYARVENETTGCFNLSGFYVYINTLPEFIPITNYENCEADIAGVADFYFYLKDTEILNGQSDKQVLYYETEADAIAGIDPIDKYSAYQNTTGAQTIYVRVESYTDPNCFGTSSFELEVGSIPIFNPAETIVVCDDISNDGFVTVDLNETIAQMVEGSPETLDITFHITEFDANNNFNPVPLSYTNSTNPQQLFARVDNGNYCKGISAFEINVISAPLVYPASPVERCDTDYDGILTWDLTLSEIEILDVRQDNIEVSYFENLDDLETDTNPILDPENYNNTSNPQTVFIKVNNTLSDCFVNIPLDLIVNLPPLFNDFETVEICDNPTTSFDLSTVNQLLVDDATDTLISYHIDSTDANANVNPLDTNFIYTATSHNFVARLAYGATECYTTHPFELIINPLPIANQPNNMETCDDTSNDSFEVFNLMAQNSSVLQGQNPSIFEVSYHNSVSDAESGDNALPEDYNAQNNEIIFARVTNTNTGCFSLTDFSTIVYPAPSSVTPITICDTDYDGINSFDLTTAEAELYATIPSNVSISYFETLEQLDDNTDQIASPTNYTNLSNPQTVYIRVFNTAANCYTAVPLEIITNLPPPINDFGIFEICDNPTSNFDLTEIESVLIDSETQANLLYFESFDKANNNSDPFALDYTFQSINDIIFVRIEDPMTGCYFIYDFILQVNPLPIANQPSNIEVCDDDTNDGLEPFDLESQTNTVLGTQNPDDFTVTYHLSLTEARTDENAILSEYISSNQLIIVRIENNETGCFSLTDFSLIVNPHPNIPEPLLECDTDYDANTLFDLTVVEPDLFTTPNPDNSISYFESLEALENDSNPILNPENYINTTNPQTVFIKVYNSVADCFTFVPLELNVNLPPATNSFEIFDICENDANSFDLTTMNEVIVDINFNVLFSYFSSEADAVANDNALDTNYIYTSTSDIIYARVEFSTTHCYYIFPFELRVNPLPIANQPENLGHCDDDFDGLYDFTLSQQNASILGNQNANNFNVTYFNNPVEADEGINALDSESYIGFNNELIIARIENNITGCFSLVDFSLIIHRKPDVNIPNQVVCIDNLPLTVSAETYFATDTYLWSTDQIGPEIDITEIGTYSVTVTSEFGCSTLSTFNVTESESATIDVVETVDFSDPNNITVTIEEGIGDYLYILDDGDPQESNVFENVPLGYHTVTIIDLNGCAEVTEEVLVIDAPPFFTPNGDTINETWHIVGIETLPGSEVYIFNRYGKLITKLNANSQGWDGQYNGYNMPASDYWFLAEIKQGGIAFEVKGHFALRR
ncbi:T9SS type B sorting domain-containing protein [Winogradskyella forsetii]|uniref:T9SS type B sorting domain-containing protein n=1 Tax=Winogradskyella forsetii TaxID=2686077 RepID=UPI0015BB3C7E|nr:choice-of-anchor L domain-containing protein [Winogradskyella forsetii]